MVEKKTNVHKAFKLKGEPSSVQERLKPAEKVSKQAHSKPETVQKDIPQPVKPKDPVWISEFKPLLNKQVIVRLMSGERLEGILRKTLQYTLHLETDNVMAIINKSAYTYMIGVKETALDNTVADKDDSEVHKEASSE